MSTYQSVQSASVENSNNLIITKPTSLAVGDLMLAGIWADRDGGSSASISIPTGWTEEETIDPSTLGNARLSVFSKIADSADVAASNFSFPGTGSTAQMHMIGHILRFTDFGQKIGDSSGYSGGAISSFSFSGFTPSIERSTNTYVIFSGFSDNGGNPTTTGYAIATSNPTWTERAEASITGSTRVSVLGVATASRPEYTATGDVTITYSTGLSSPRCGGIIIGLTPIVNGSHAVTTGNTYIVNHPFLRNGVTQIDGVDPDALAIQPTTTWTTITKS